MPQGYSSQAGYVVLRSQAVQGTYQADTSTAGIAVPLRGNAGLGSDRTLMLPDPEVGGNRDIANGYLGPIKWSGGYDFYGRINSLLPILKGALGSVGSVTTTGITTHTFTGSDGATLPYFSIDEGIGAGLDAYSYNDAVFNTLHLEAAADGYLMGTVGVIAANMIVDATPDSVASMLDVTPMIPGTNITIQLNGITLPAKSFTFDLNNNVDDTDWRLGSFYLGSLLPKRREVTFSVVIRQQDATLWRQAVLGTSAATQAGGVKTSQPLVVTINSYEYIAGGTPATTPYSLSLTVPAATLTPYNLGANADAIIEPTLTIQAFRPAPATPILTAVAKTGQATIF